MNALPAPCQFCGLRLENACTELPPDLCDKANEALLSVQVAPPGVCQICGGNEGEHKPGCQPEPGGYY